MRNSYGSRCKSSLENRCVKRFSRRCHKKILLWEKLLIFMSNFLFKGLFLARHLSVALVEIHTQASQKNPKIKSRTENNICFI